MTIPSISYSQDNLNKYARDYIKSSLIINYYSEGRPLFENINLGSDNIFPESGFKYVIEIKTYNNSYLTNFKDIKLYEYTFEFIYTSDSSIWNSRLGCTELKLKDYLEVYSNNTNSPAGIEEINLLQKKGLIAEAKDGEFYIINKANNNYLDITTVSKEKYQVNNISEVILLRYFHYSPRDINVNIERSSFSFYSNTLERYLNGKLKYQLMDRSYNFELEDGVLIGD